MASHRRRRKHRVPSTLVDIGKAFGLAFFMAVVATAAVIGLAIILF